MLTHDIKTPCQEDWNQMAPTEKGRHCDKCAFQVTDFTAMSDAEVQAYMLQAPGRVCGHIQANRLPGYQLRRALAVFAAAFLLVFGSGGVAQAQRLTEYPSADSLNTPGIYGRVVDKSTKLPIPDATVHINVGTVVLGPDTLHTQTDSLGRYFIPINHLPEGSIQLQASAPEYIGEGMQIHWEDWILIRVEDLELTLEPTRIYLPPPTVDGMMIEWKAPDVEPHIDAPDKPDEHPPR